MMAALSALALFAATALAVPAPDADHDLVVDAYDSCPTDFNPRNIGVQPCHPDAGTSSYVNWAVDQFGYPLSAPGLCWSQSNNYPPGSPPQETCTFETDGDRPPQVGGNIS